MNKFLSLLKKTERLCTTLLEDIVHSKRIARTGAFFYRCYRLSHSFRGKKSTLFKALTFVFVVTTLSILVMVNEMFIVHVPAHGGSLTEGVIGAPRFINPLLALSDTDRDLTALVYSGLLRATPEGELIPDLAKSYTLGDDGVTYTFTLKDNLFWHDGKKITSDDVVFTIEHVQDSILKSPKRASWEGVEVEKIDEKTVVFTLKRKYSPFLENTTLGILPKHIWGNISSEQFGFSKFNIEPIGSGPYKVVKTKSDSSGIPEYYLLESFRDFALGQPYVHKIAIHFYPNEEAVIKGFNKREVEAVNAIAFKNISELTHHGQNISNYVLPRVFGVFFNQNQNSIFTSFSIRKALHLVTPREQIIDEVLLGYGTPIDGPLPPGSLGFTEEKALDEDYDILLKEAGALLEKAGWELNEETGFREKKGELLTFSLATSDTPELKRTAELLKESWEKVGVQVNLQIFSASDLNLNVIRPRKYEALLFGEIIGRESDPFAFWHSSQRNDPGLNIALYTNIEADGLLEKGRVAFDKDERVEIYEQFQEEIRNDIPAVFIYSPDFIYILPEKILGASEGTIAVPSERFLDVHTWYIETERLWKFFIKN